MNCLQSQKNFSELFDDRLSRDVKERVGMHLASCEACRLAYSEYEFLFAALRSLPVTTTQAVPPTPLSAGAFRSRPAPSSPWMRFGSVGAAILLCVAIGKAGFELGRWSGDSESVSTDVESHGSIAGLGLPSKPAGERLRRAANATEQLALMVDASSRLDQPDRSAGIIHGFLKKSPLAEDVRLLAEMDEESLGAFVSPTHEFSREVIKVCNEVERECRARDVDRATLLRTRDVIWSSRLREYLDLIENVAIRFDPLPMNHNDFGVEALEVDLVEDRPFVQAMIYSSSGNFALATRSLDDYLRAQKSMEIQMMARTVMPSSILIQPISPGSGSGDLTIFSGVEGLGRRFVPFKFSIRGENGQRYRFQMEMKDEIPKPRKL